MAEIKVEKKKSIWVWVLIIAALLAVGFAYFYFSTNEEPQSPPEKVLEGEKVTVGLESEVGLTAKDGIQKDNAVLAKANLEVAEYNSYIMDKNRMGKDMEYTRNALVQLYNTLQAVAVSLQMGEVEGLESLKYDIQKTTGTPKGEAALSASIQELGNSMVAIMDIIQKERFPEFSPKVENLGNTVREIDPKIPFPSQKEAINAFFDQTGALLKEMNLKNKE
jgi:flagellar basal body-associated protein FliL